VCVAANVSGRVGVVPSGVSRAGETLVDKFRRVGAAFVGERVNGGVRLVVGAVG